MARCSSSNDNLNPEASLAHLHHSRAAPTAQAEPQLGQINGQLIQQKGFSERISPGAAQLVQEGDQRRADSHESSSAIDTAALQKEVTELRQQV